MRTYLKVRVNLAKVTKCLTANAILDKWKHSEAEICFQTFARLPDDGDTEDTEVFPFSPLCLSGFLTPPCPDWERDTNIDTLLETPVYHKGAGRAS
jgi:hypothetical protein